MATKKQGPASTSRVTRKKGTSAPRTARVKHLAEAAGLDAVAATEAVAVTETVAVAETVTVADTVTVPEPVAILPPPVERVIPKHPWFGEPPARLLGRFLDAWKRRVEKRIAARLPPWIARLVARYGPASMQQRKPVE